MDKYGLYVACIEGILQRANFESLGLNYNFILGDQLKNFGLLYIFRYGFYWKEML